MGGCGGGGDRCCDRALFRAGDRGVAGCRGGEVGADGIGCDRDTRGVRVFPWAVDLAFHHRETQMIPGFLV